MRPLIAKTVLAAVGTLCLATAALAQDDPHAACTSMSWVPQEILERPVGLRSETGNALDVATTASIEALALYRQGLNYLHGYVWIEAARSFNQALRADPNLALAFWGLSRTYSGLDDQEAAVRAAQRAQALSGGATPREQRRIALMDRLDLQ